MSKNDLELLLIHPGGRRQVFQDLGESLTAVEPPLWCGLIATNLRNHGCSVEIIDSDGENLSSEMVAKMVAEKQPLLVGMIVFGHQPSASTQMMPSAGVICTEIKTLLPEQKIIIVGGHVAALPERTLAEESVDFTCNGEGPLTIRGLIECLRRDEESDLGDIQGLVWRDGETIRINPAAPLIENLDRDLPGSAWDLLPMENYRAHNWHCFEDLSARQPYASVYTSLGCPFRCSFCCINAPFGMNRYRMRSAESVVNEIELLYRDYGVRNLKIVDEMFVLNDRHVTGICEELIDRGFAHDLNIWAYARVDTIRPNRISLLRRAGIRWLALGIESGSAYVRDGAEKSLDHNDIVNIVRETQQAGINVIGNFIFGLPNDDEASLAETLGLAKALNCEFVNFYSAMAYPGSPLHVMAEQNGWKLPQSWNGYSQHAYETLPLPTQKLSAAEVLRFRDDAFHEYFTNPDYLDMIAGKFGGDARRHIEDMVHYKLPRKLFESASGGASDQTAEAASA
jgi:radical SAM superfamily enzyme YgiQ (UPF0313 family)